MRISLPGGEETQSCSIVLDNDELYLRIDGAHEISVRNFCKLLMAHIAEVAIEKKSTLTFGTKWYPMEITPSFFVRGIRIDQRGVNFYINKRFLKKPFSYDDMIGIVESSFDIVISK